MQEISQGAVNLESALKRKAGASAGPAGTAKKASEGGMDFNLFSKMLAMDKHTTRGAPQLLTTFPRRPAVVATDWY